MHGEDRLQSGSVFISLEIIKAIKCGYIDFSVFVITVKLHFLTYFLFLSTATVKNPNL